MEVEIRHLRYFVAVAEEGNFARAAARLHMAASPLSQRIKYLERELGNALFARAHHRVILTAAGEVLLPAAIDILDRFDAVPRLVAEALGTPTRVAVIGIAPDVSASLRDGLLNALAAKQPHISPRLVPASTEPLLRELRAGRLDLALVHGAVTERGLCSTELEAHPGGVVVGRRTALGGRTSIRLCELATMPYASINPEAAPEIYRRVDDLLNTRGVYKRITLTGDNFAGLAHLVAAGQAFTIVTLDAGRTSRFFHGEPVTVLAIEDLDATISTVAVWRETQTQTNTTVADLVCVVNGLVADPDPN